MVVVADSCSFFLRERIWVSFPAHLGIAMEKNPLCSSNKSINQTPKQPNEVISGVNGGVTLVHTNDTSSRSAGMEVTSSSAFWQC